MVIGSGLLLKQQLRFQDERAGLRGRHRVAGLSGYLFFVVAQPVQAANCGRDKVIHAEGSPLPFGMGRLRCDALVPSGLTVKSEHTRPQQVRSKTRQLRGTLRDPSGLFVFSLSQAE